MLTIKLTYFKQTGKYYTQGAMLMDFCSFHTIIDRVRRGHEAGTLPGLVDGACRRYYVLIETPEVGGAGPHGVPHLLAPLKKEE
jgi:hypothetical protein